MTEASATVFLRDYCTCGGVGRRMAPFGEPERARQAARVLAEEGMLHVSSISETLLSIDEHGLVYVAEEVLRSWCVQCYGEKLVPGCAHDYAACDCPLVPCPRCQE